jgi:hypothetical protein
MAWEPKAAFAALAERYIERQATTLAGARPTPV